MVWFAITNTLKRKLHIVKLLLYFQLKGISTEQFIKDEQHSMKMHDCGVFGYRGLTGM